MIARTNVSQFILKSRLRWTWMIPLLLVATLLTAPGLNADLIWYDELTSISHAGGVTGPFAPLDVVASLQKHSPKHTPLFFELLAGWGAFVGWHHAVLRCLPLYFGLIALACVYRLGTDFINCRAGILAAAFLGLNVFWLEYFHEIRMYTLQFLLLAALTWSYFFVSRANSIIRRIHWAGLTLSAALLLYVQPISIFVHIALGFYHLFFVRKTKTWLHVTYSFFLAGLLYLPWLPTTLHSLTAKFDTMYTSMTFSHTTTVFVRLLSNGSPFLLAALTLIAVLQLRDRVHRRRVQPFWFLALISVVLLLAANEAFGLIPIRRPRYFFVTWCFLALAIGGALAKLKPSWIAPIFLVAYLISGFNLRNADDYVGYQGTVSVVSIYPPLTDYVTALRGKTQAHDYVLGFSTTGFINRSGKLGKSTADYYLETLLGIDGFFVTNKPVDDDFEENLALDLTENPYLLLTFDPLEPAANLDNVRAVLRRHYIACDVVLDETHLFVQRYVYQSLTCDREYQPIHYENGITIVDYVADYNPSTDTIRVVTGWDVADQDLLQLYNVSFQILTDDWQNVVQAPDKHLYNDVLKWYVVELTTADLPPGDYRAVVIVYDRYRSSAKVTGVISASGETGTILPVLHFTVED